MGTIGQTKAAEMAYRKVQELKAQFYRRDLNPADDYKGSLMRRGETRREDRTQKISEDRQQQQMLKLAKIASRIEQGFKKE